MSAGPILSKLCVRLQVKPTEASYTLRDPHEVLTFLTKLVEWGQTSANAWHQNESCIGWALNTGPIMPCSQNGTHAAAPHANGDGAPQTLPPLTFGLTVPKFWSVRLLQTRAYPGVRLADHPCMLLPVFQVTRTR